MPIRPSKDVKAKYLELPIDLDSAVNDFAADRGQTYRSVVVDALRRHLAYPPPLPDTAPAPIPDAGNGSPKKSRKKS